MSSILDDAVEVVKETWETGEKKRTVSGLSLAQVEEAPRLRGRSQRFSGTAHRQYVQESLRLRCAEAVFDSPRPVLMK